MRIAFAQKSLRHWRWTIENAAECRVQLSSGARWSLHNKVQRSTAAFDFNRLAVAIGIFGDIVDRQPITIVPLRLQMDEFVVGYNRRFSKSTHVGHVLAAPHFIRLILAVDNFRSKSRAATVSGSKRNGAPFHGFAIVTHRAADGIGLPAACNAPNTDSNQQNYARIISHRPLHTSIPACPDRPTLASRPPSKHSC